jgi:hypothetical protein
MDTQLEVMERKLDRAIENKERITVRLALGLGDDYRVFAAIVAEYQQATADTIQIFLE